MRQRIRDLKDKLENKVRDRVRAAIDSATNAALSAAAGASDETANTGLQARSKDDLVAAEDEPPVVARLMVEIRSDGSRTIARGALKDEMSGEQVSLVARGNSPLELAAQLTRALVTAPLTAGQLAKAMLQNRAKAAAGSSAGSSHPATSTPDTGAAEKSTAKPSAATPGEEPRS